MFWYLPLRILSWSGSSRILRVSAACCWCGEGATWRSAAAVSPSAALPAETSPSPFAPRPDVVCSPAEGLLLWISLSGVAAGERSKQKLVCC